MKADQIEINQNINDYLKKRNKSFYRGHSAMIHPLYEKELNNAINSIKLFLSNSVLSTAYYNRLRNIYNLSTQQCFNVKANNYTYSQAKGSCLGIGNTHHSQNRHS